MTTSTLRHRGMGSTVDLSVHGDPCLIDLARERIECLERRWSRFLVDSEISRCNTTRGVPVFVSADTRRLVRHGVEAWRRTAGACDPSVLDALVAAGYDRSFDDLGAEGPSAATPRPTPTVGCADIEIDDHLGSVTLPADTGFDPGAVGKGLAADMVAEELMAAGATGVFVSIGGDLRVAGSPEHGDGWAIPIHEPTVSTETLGELMLRAGGVATSTDRKRRWRHRGTDSHHVIDPTTGAPSSGDAVLVTVVAGAAWWAEALATQLLLTPREGWRDVVGTHAALIVDTDGERHRLGAVEGLLR